jgi:hypothetical protein
VEQRIFHCVIDRAFVAAHEALDVLGPAYWSVNIYDGPAAYEATLTRFTRAQRLALAVFWYQAEVNNGGHRQSFTNATGIVSRDALAGLETFGLPDFLAVLRAALQRLGGSVSLDRETREAAVDGFLGTFDDLDEGFYALDRRHDLLACLSRWIHAHPGEFTFEVLVERTCL